MTPEAGQPLGEDIDAGGEQDGLYLRLLGLAAGIGGTAKHYAAAVHASYTRGHGVAAEHASCLIDKAAGRAVEHLGGNNALNGADRKVAGMLIQTKYCASGSRCIAECFDAGGFCYRGPDGLPMQIEVPSDLYEAAVQAMEHRIRTGQVSGVAEPEQARRIVRRGHLTYEQARNLGRAGKVESLLYDSATGAMTALWPLGLSSAVRFAQGRWQGEDLSVALGEAARTGFGVGGTTMLTHVLAKQLARTSLDGAMIPASRWVVAQLGVEGTRALARASGRSALTGAAAASHAAKLLRGNVVTAAVTSLVLSSADVARLVNGSISGSQAFKNIANTVAGVAGGTAGWVGGATAGAAVGSVVPVIGTAAGALVGSLVGSVGSGLLASKSSRWLLDRVVEDDVVALGRVVEEAMAAEAEAHLLGGGEVETLVERVRAALTPAFFRAMHKSGDRLGHARALCAPIAFELLATRPEIETPDLALLAA